MPHKFRVFQMHINSLSILALYIGHPQKNYYSYKLRIITSVSDNLGKRKGKGSFKKIQTKPCLGPKKREETFKNKFDSLHFFFSTSLIFLFIINTSFLSLLPQIPNRQKLDQSIDAESKRNKCFANFEGN